MTSNYNNTLTYTIDDYFRKNMYEGDIVKTTNLMGKSLAQEVGSDPEALKLAQDSIEKQLKTFGEKLWVMNDTTVVTDKTETKETKKEAKSSARRGRGSQEKVEKQEKTKAPKSENTAPTRSVRRTRR